ncbi:unnamed protein product [Meganyctiphanes norvegica]|uniref:General transcription factor IIH subunit 3 n=1 Tax=Meganyctiphanes norvegica TaxID=48144 RepID=A0AAV2QIE5_MEGNR
MADEGCLLAVVLDVHPQLSECDELVSTYLNSFMAFCNFHLASNTKNTLAVVAANHNETRFLYPRVQNREEIQHQESRQQDGRLEQLGSINISIIEELKEMMSFNLVVNQSDCLLAGAIGRALLYIKRREIQHPLGKKINSRILVIKYTSEAGGHYLNFVNTYLTAQKMHTAIDVFVIGNDSTLLQQGADISGGFYHRIDEVGEMMQNLILLYSPDISMRKRISAPTKISVDYRASCFCHRNLVEVGNVCSNCLSVYCMSVPLCTTCHAMFGHVRKPSKNKKKK